MSGQPTVADYIVGRLAREGITDCFGVPGDFVFKLCDAVARSDGQFVQVALDRGAGLFLVLGDPVGARRQAGRLSWRGVLSRNAWPYSGREKERVLLPPAVVRGGP